MKELEQLFLGKKLGSGMHRTAYVYALNPKWVIKVADDELMGRGANALEYKLWEELKYSDEGKWFAPVIDMSDGAKYIIQERAEMGRLKDYPNKIPAFFTDIKRDNFGFIKNRLVCVDFGSLMIWREINCKKLKKVTWD